MMLFLLVGLIGIQLGSSTFTLPSMAPFDLESDVVSQTAYGAGKVGFSYFGQQPVNIIYGNGNCTLAIDLENKRWFLGCPTFGRNWFFPDVSYFTAFDQSGQERCGYVDAGWELERISLGLMNNKGSVIVEDPGNSNRKYTVDIFNGDATDNSQCNVSNPYEWMIDNGNRNPHDYGLLRVINADTPLDVPQPAPAPPGTVVTVVVKQHYAFVGHIKGTPDPQHFDLPDICNATLRVDWCSTYFSRGLIPLYQSLGV